MTSPASRGSRFSRDSKRSAGGQLEHPCEVNSSTTTGPCPAIFPGSRASRPRTPPAPIAATASATAASATATIPRAPHCTFGRDISASSAAARRPLASDYTAGKARRLGLIRRQGGRWQRGGSASEPESVNRGSGRGGGPGNGLESVHRDGDASHPAGSELPGRIPTLDLERELPRA